MLDLYTWKTANCQKVNIAVCELDLPIEIHPVDIRAGDQKRPEYLVINPNGKVPAVRDRDTGVTLFESGAILLYLAETSGALIPRDRQGRWAAIQWVFWQMSSIGSVGGQLNHFNADPARGDYARDRFAAEFNRLLGVLETVLADRQYLAGAYSIADIAVWPWLSRFPKMGIDLAARPAIARWYRAIAARPQVARGFQMLNEGAEIPMP